MSRRRTLLAVLSTSCVLVGCSAGTTSSKASGPSAAGASDMTAVTAQRQRYATDPASPVAHDTETLALTAQEGRLFAATGQWEYPGPNAHGQVLVKNTAGSPWQVFEQTQSLRVQALDSFAVPADQGLGPRHSLLVTQAVVDGKSELQWALDGARSFDPSDAYVLSSPGDEVRAFGAHEAGGEWAVYAGVNPTGILRGTWSRSTHTVHFDPNPELSVATGAPGVPARKVTGFAECAGALYATINAKLYRRNDGTLPPGAARWVLVYQEPQVGPRNSGLRGITCVQHLGKPSLLLSTEGNGDVYRFDDLPRGRLDASATAVPGNGVSGLVPSPEFSPIPAIRRMLTNQGTNVPERGEGSIVYVIAAYNNGDFGTVKIDGAPRQPFGFEWGYLGVCPPTRTCGPVTSGLVHFDAAACFAVRTDVGPTQTYDLRCLSGPDFTTSREVGNPVRSGRAFVSIRTIVPSPFGDGRLYYGGYDCNFYPADGTAWVASSTPGAIHWDDHPTRARS